MLTNANNFTPKNAGKIECKLCDFKCCKQSDFNRHLLTRKHINANKMLTILRQKTPIYSHLYVITAIRISNIHLVCLDTLYFSLFL